MASEIKILRNVGQIRYQCVFLYTAPNITDKIGVVVAPTPSTDIPKAVFDILSVQERNALDSGNSILELVTIKIKPGATDAEVITQAQSLYTSKRAEAITHWSRVYAWYGFTVDAV